MVVSLLLAALVKRPAIEFAWSIPFNSNSNYARGVSPSASEPGAVVFQVPGEPIYRLDLATKSLSNPPLQELLPYQTDCGLGLASGKQGGKVLTFDVASGKLLTSFEGDARERIGDQIRFVSMPSRSFNCVSGTENKSIATYPRFRGHVWSTPRKQIILQTWFRPKNDSDKDLVFIDPKSGKELKRTFLSSYAMSFDHVLGNPELGAFAVFEASNRSFYPTGVFGANWRRNAVDWVLDLEKHLALIRKVKSGDLATNADFFPYTDIVNLDTGKRLGRIKGDQFGLAFLGNYIWGGGKIYDKTSGKQVGTYKFPERSWLLSRIGSSFVLKCSNPNRIEVWKFKD